MLIQLSVRSPAVTSGEAPAAGASAPSDSVGSQGEAIKGLISRVFESFSSYQEPVDATYL